MDREKQIEKMAREMCHLSAECKTCQICNERYHGDDYDLCYFKCVAKEIINHGYRKQSEVIDEFVKKLKDTSMTKWDYHEAVDVEEIDRIAAKMKGGTEE